MGGFRTWCLSQRMRRFERGSSGPRPNGMAAGQGAPVWLKKAAPPPPAGGANQSQFLARRLNSNPRPAMTQTTNRFFDEMARLMNDAAGVASGVRREFDTMVRNQADRILGDLDVVKREEFEAVKEMARLAREENEALKARI